MGELLWALAGAGATLACGGLGWLYWRFWGAGSLREFVSEEEEPEGQYRIVLRKRTATQRIALVECGSDMLVYANGYVMFGTTADDTLYAETLIHVPMAVAAQRQRVLIIGGGGGITAREVLRYPEVTELTVVDIDAIMMEFGRNLPALVRFNKGSLSHPKVRTVIQDGRAFVEGNPGPWDVIVVDLPEPSPDCPALGRLFSREFYRLLADRLAPGGVMAVACSTPSWLPEYFWSVNATLKAAGFHTLPYRLDVMVEYEEDWGFILAARRPVSADDVRIAVALAELSPKQVPELFRLPYGLLQYRRFARVQTDSNSVLLEMVAEAEDD